MRRDEGESQPIGSLSEAALQYARDGWPVFPLVGKAPVKGSQGYKDATKDLENIRAWWRHYPTANIGLATGSLSGLIVLDVDPHHGGYQSFQALEKRYGTVPETRMSRTAHGGLHRFYQHPRDGKSYPNAVEFEGLPGIDVRGDGGYVVLPPSKLYGRLSYVWGKTNVPIAPAPEWFLEALTREKSRQERTLQERDFAQEAGRKWLAEAVERAREGNRNQIGFHLACQLRDDGLSEAQAENIMLSYVDQVGPGKTSYTAKEAHASLRSAYRRPPRAKARRSHEGKAPPGGER
jgi:hypothetical protein